MFRARIEYEDANAEGARHSGRLLRVIRARIGWIDEIGNRSSRRHHFLQQLGAFAYDFEVQKTHAGDVAARPIETGNETDADRVVYRREYDGNGPSRSFSSERRGRAAGRKQGGHAQVNEFGRQNRQPVVVALRPAKGDQDILPLDESRCTDLAGRLPRRPRNLRASGC